MACSNCSNFPTENISWIGYCKEVNQRLVIRPLTNKVRREYCVSYTTTAIQLILQKQTSRSQWKFFRFLGKFPANFISPATNYDCCRTLTYFSSIFVWRFNDQYCATTLQTFVTKLNRWTTTFSLSANNTTLQHLNLAVEKLIMGNLAMIYF